MTVVPAETVNVWWEKSAIVAVNVVSAGTLVAVGGTAVEVGGTGVDVGGTGVDVGGAGVDVGDSPLDEVGVGEEGAVVAVAWGSEVGVDGTDVAVGAGVGVAVAAA